MPVDEMVATVGVLLLHMPSVDVVFRLVVKPGHTVNTPIIASGSGFTVIIFVTERTHPEPLVTFSVTGKVPDDV